jgi:hypothetical protein
MRRHWYLVIAGAIAAALAAVPLSAAAASAVLTVGSTSGSAVAHNDVLIGTLSGNANFVNTASSSQKVTCTGSTVTATDLTNPAPGGTATESISDQTFSGCTLSGVVGASIKSVTTNANAPGCAWGGAVTDGSGTNNVTISPSTNSGCNPIQATVTVTIFGFDHPCVYQPSGGNIVGSATLMSSAGVSFGSGSTVTFDKVSGVNTCFAHANFSALYPFQDQTQSNGAVFTN